MRIFRILNHSLELYHSRCRWGSVSLARENEAGGRKSIFSILTYSTLFCFCSQKGCFSYKVRRIITSRSNGTLCRWQWSRKSWTLIDYYGGCHGISGKYLCLAILTNNEECHFRAVQPVWGKCIHVLWLCAFKQLVQYKCLSKPQRIAMQNANPVKDTYGLKSCYYLQYVNRYMSKTMIAW